MVGEKGKTRAIDQRIGNLVAQKGLERTLVMLGVTNEEALKEVKGRVSREEDHLKRRAERIASVRGAKGTDVRHASNMLCLTIETEISKGMLEEAKETAKEIRDKAILAGVLADIAKAEAKAGMTEEARETFKEAKKAAKRIIFSFWQYPNWECVENERASELSAILFAELEVGMIDEAKETARAQRYGGYRLIGLFHVAIAEAKAGRIEEAKATVREMGEEAEGVHRDLPLRYIAKAEAKAGRPEDAKRTAEMIQDKEEREEVLGLIAGIKKE